MLCKDKDINKQWDNHDHAGKTSLRI